MSARAHWERADIAAGLPQVYLPTSETFVAQMLNLDLLGAIAFDKGCYTGQEVIARAHYRGRVKRRLQRWHARAAARAAPGDERAHRRRTVAHRGARRGRRGRRMGSAGGGKLRCSRAGSGGGRRRRGRERAGREPLPLPYSLPE